MIDSEPAATTTSLSEACGAARPFLKWAGGKQRLLAQFDALFPGQFGRYFEPFVGSGAVFFHLWNRGVLRNGVTLCDSNPEIVCVYEVVRDQVDALIEHLKGHAASHDHAHYYAVRSLDRESGFELGDVERAARTIYLNKTCYNGLYRVNRRGHFNVPMGSYVAPPILKEETLRAASHALQGAHLRAVDFESLLDAAGPGDFVYLDPPYVPVSATASFTSYTQDDFGLVEQKRLAAVYRELDARGCLLMLSNSHMPLVRDLYRGFHLHVVQAGRAINSRADARGAVEEVVVRNYRA